MYDQINIVMYAKIRITCSTNAGFELIFVDVHASYFGIHIYSGVVLDCIDS